MRRRGGCDQLVDGRVGVVVVFAVVPSLVLLLYFLPQYKEGGVEFHGRLLASTLNENLN